MPAGVARIVINILSLFEARSMAQHCTSMPMLSRDVVWDAPPFLLSRKGSVRVSSYFFKFFAQQRFVPSHIEVLGACVVVHLMSSLWLLGGGGRGRGSPCCLGCRCGLACPTLLLHLALRFDPLLLAACIAPCSVGHLLKKLPPPQPPPNPDPPPTAAGAPCRPGPAPAGGEWHPGGGPPPHHPHPRQPAAA
jgi:hypothetical protein